jgi:putative membrane protein
VPLLAKLLTWVVFFIHVYIVVLETALFDTRGVKVFRLSAEQATHVKRVMSNQGCYNGFLAAALLLGLCHPNAEVAKAFVYYGLGCVAVAGLWGAATVHKRILFVQTIPAALAIAAWLIA